MATYFHGMPEIQGDGLQTLYLMNPGHVSYTEAPAQANMVFFNSVNPQQQSQQHLLGVPVQPSAADSGRHPIQATTTHNMSAIHQGLSSRPHYNTSVRPWQGLSQSVVMGSKYLKAAQQLLDEAVNVGKGEQTTTERKYAKSPMKSDEDAEGGRELTIAERQELQMKKAKLVSMLDQVQQTYRQYHHQMQIVVSSFEAAAGFGSARSYTDLALRTMSKQFRCLRDAISGQIRGACRSLGEEDCLTGGNRSVGSRLRLADHHLRQQRVLQQLGMMQYNAWRPQRGLPEHAVSVLRAWLFEHFLHPYPKDSDKHMLAKETGLTRSQVSNWFINARVRLWKPMIEEMYLEESKEQEHNNADEKTSMSDDSEHAASRFTSSHVESPTRTDRTDSFRPNQDTRPITFDTEQHRMKKAGSNESQLRQDNMSNGELMMKFMDHGGGFGQYEMGGIGREQLTPRYGGNGVSLTLGLPHCELQPPYFTNENITMGKRLDMGSVESNYFGLSNNNGSCYQTM